MLDEYFSIKISPCPSDPEGGTLDSLPLLLKGYTPNLDRLPYFLLCLGTRIDWNDEKGCFKSVLEELAFFYSPRPDDNVGADGADGEEESETKHYKWQLEHILWPSMRKYTAWTRDSLTNGDLKQVANLPDLFKVFERC
jgi:DNA mismatch repair protein MLH1